MRLHPDCVPCMYTMILGVARLITDDEDEVWRIMRTVLKNRAFSPDNADLYSPVATAEMWQEITRLTGDPDPLRKAKQRQNKLAMEIYPRAKRIVAASSDPFMTALRLAIAGNALDAMVRPQAEPNGDLLLEQLELLPMKAADADAFRERVAAAERIAWLADNCGEIVFDKLLLEVIREQYGRRVVCVVRSVPVVNDATLAEAREVGLGEVARVVGNGISEPMPTTVLAKLSPEVRGLLAEADLIVAKGGANYELLGEEEEPKGRISFLLHGKCRPLCSAHKAQHGELVVCNA